LPLGVWLPIVAEHAAPLTTALLVSIVDGGVVLELAQLRLAQPWVFADGRALWLCLALVSALGGALLALASRDLKRLLAFSSIDGMGYVILGLVIGPGPGLTGALLGAAGHAAATLLLFAAVAVAEVTRGKALTLETRGVAASCPTAAAAFIVGALAALGTPPMSGFPGRWRLYEAALASGGPPLLGALLLATVLAALYYVRAIHRVWLGDGGADDPEPARGAAALRGLIVAALLLGALPLALP
jgi:formate hydrogenlyase subunit 3/multisubunit Na+/H+ antiporter MnhD subunit